MDDYVKILTVRFDIQPSRITRLLTELDKPINLS